MAAVEGESHLDDGWGAENHDGSMVEITSSEDELLSPTPEGSNANVTNQKLENIRYSFYDYLFDLAEAEEAATWLIDVGLGDIVDNLMENNQLVTETSLANAVIEDNLTSNQYQTIRRRVETLRVTLKSRKTRTGAGQQRPDCRDIFRDPEVSTKRRNTQKDKDNILD